MRRGLNLPTRHSKEVYNRLDECVRSYCGLIFNPFAALEWVEGKATTKSSRALAAVVDSVKLKYIIEADYLVYTREIVDKCREQDPKVQVPDFPVFQNLSDSRTVSSALGILIGQVPDYLENNRRAELEKNMPFSTKVPAFSAQQWTDGTVRWKQENPETYQERVDSFKASLAEDIKRKDEYLNNPQGYRKSWMIGYLKIDKILRAFNPQVDIDGVLHSIDGTQCRAVSLYWTVREKRMVSGNPPEDNDVDDYMFLPVVPYADVVLTERNLRAFILQADNSLQSKVFSKASDALNILENRGLTWSHFKVGHCDA